MKPKLPKYLSGPTVVKKAQKHEKRVAKKLDGETQRGSGSQSFHKADLKTIDILVECKLTSHDSLSLKKAWLVKINSEAIAYNRIPALSIEFETMPNLVPRDWTAIPTEKLKYLLDCAKYLNDIND